MKYSPYFLSLILFLIIPMLVYSQQENVEEGLTDSSYDITVYKTPNCMCCDKWAAYLEDKGFSVNLIPSDTLATIKDQNNIPKDLRSCHTGLINGYVVEGHVPVESIRKLLEERPDAKGIAVPGMPTGSPGMGLDGTPYEVFLFDGEEDTSIYGKINAEPSN